jgi:hypothetical protein
MSFTNTIRLVVPFVLIAAAAFAVAGPGRLHVQMVLGLPPFSIRRRSLAYDQPLVPSGVNFAGSELRTTMAAHRNE